MLQKNNDMLIAGIAIASTVLIAAVALSALISMFGAGAATAGVLLIPVLIQFRL